MKISELISELVTVLKTHGDLPVYIEAGDPVLGLYPVVDNYPEPTVFIEHI